MTPFFWKIFNFFSFILGGQFLLPQKANMEKREFIQLQIGWYRGDWVPGAFKLDHLQPFEPILSKRIFNFFTFILGGQFLLPQKANNQKREFFQPQIGAFQLDHLQPFEPILSQKIFNFFTFILGGQFLLPQRDNMKKRDFTQLQNWMRQRGFSAWGIQTGPFAAL